MGGNVSILIVLDQGCSLMAVRCFVRVNSTSLKERGLPYGRMMTRSSNYGLVPLFLGESLRLRPLNGQVNDLTININPRDGTALVLGSVDDMMT